MHRQGFFQRPDIVYIVLYFTIYAVDSIVRVVKEFWYCIYHAENYQVIFNVIFYNKCRSIVHRQGWSQRSDIEFFIYWNMTKYSIFILQYMLQQSASSGVVAEVWYCCQLGTLLHSYATPTPRGRNIKSNLVMCAVTYIGLYRLFITLLTSSSDMLSPWHVLYRESNVYL